MHPIVIVFMVLGCVIAAVNAAGKNRNVAGWAVCGALFPLIGVIAILCLPALPAPGEEPPSR